MSRAPTTAEEYYAAGNQLRKAGQTHEAAACFRKATELKTDFVEAFTALGAVLRRMGRLTEAIAACRSAIHFKPEDAAARINLANALQANGQIEDAAREFEHVLELDPVNSGALNNYANLLAATNRPARAITLYQRAIKSAPDDAQIHSNLGNLLKKQGKPDEAIACYQRTLLLRPDAWQVHSNLLLALNCQAQADAGLLCEHVRWADLHAARFYPKMPPRFTGSVSPDRKLRIGYVSPDFRNHSVAYFIGPVLAAHDPGHVEVICFSDVTAPDEMTQELRSHGHRWREIAGLSDDRVAELIRAQQVDILVDLTGHTGNHRLLVFARRVAPIQATYLGYPNTTGLATMDYRITDAESDPPGMTESHYTEQLVRLERGFLCYGPPAKAPSLRSIGSSESSVTFGSFNNYAKVTREMIGIWAEILRRTPGSRLLLKAEGLADEATRTATRAGFIQAGIEPARINLFPREPSFIRHLELYHRVDIGLDTFPYHGTTTTCEAMWMGVPVVTLAGRAHVSRVGVSLLKRVVLEELIAQDPSQYVEIAVALARDFPRRHEISSTLRERMNLSPLLDRRTFTSRLEAAYRNMWTKYLGSNS
jgi:protein O-GlcNAc transferase